METKPTWEPWTPDKEQPEALNDEKLPDHKDDQDRIKKIRRAIRRLRDE